MPVAITMSVAALRQQAQAPLSRTLRAWRIRFLEEGWRRATEDRVLRAVQQIDHPGVLADMQAARRATRR